MSKSDGEESSLIPAGRRGGRSQGPPNDQMTPLFFITSRSSHRDLSSTFRKQPALPSRLISHPAEHTSELRHEHHLRKRWRRNNDRRNVSGDIPTLEWDVGELRNQGGSSCMSRVFTFAIDSSSGAETAASVSTCLLRSTDTTTVFGLRLTLRAGHSLLCLSSHAR